MRIITGSARRRRLISPEGYDVRPTTDKVKESLFNIIQFDLDGSVFCDLFAGSGQIGLEAVSRGASKAYFIDSSKKSLDVIKTNIELCKFYECCVALCSDAFLFLKSTSEEFDFIFMDPPYNKGLCDKALEILSDKITGKTTIICETQINEILPERIGNLVLEKVYSYSSIKLSVFRRINQQGDVHI